MKKFLLRLDDEIYKKIAAKAAVTKRSLNKHLEMIIERDLTTVEGVIKDGKVEFNEEYWNTPEGAAEIAGRGQ